MILSTKQADEMATFTKLIHVDRSVEYGLKNFNILSEKTTAQHAAMMDGAASNNTMKTMSH